MKAKARLYAPGPVELPPEVLAALARPVIHHRTAAFKELFLEVRAKLAEVACVPGDEVIILTGSGSAALEAGLLACVPRGAEVLVVNAGKFGERWVKLARTFGYGVKELCLPWGRAVTPEEVLGALGPNTRALLATHSETSTGVLHDVEALARALKQASPETLVLVDCVTSLAAAELRPREWGLDGVFAGSQKGLMCPPGLAFAWLSERAWARSEGLNFSFYLDLRQERRAQVEGQSAYTPAVTLVYALNAALELVLEEGLEALWARRARLNRAVLAAGEALGCCAYAERPSPAVAALASPEGVAAPDVVRGFAARGMRVAGGQDHAKAVLFRPSLLGYADAYDAVIVAAALEEVLRALHQPVAYGQGVARALEVLSAPS